MIAFSYTFRGTRFAIEVKWGEGDNKRYIVETVNGDDEDDNSFKLYGYRFHWTKSIYLVQLKIIFSPVPVLPLF